MQEYAHNVTKKYQYRIKQISDDIMSGNIDIKPYYKVKGNQTACDYCKYKPICNFNNGICKNTYNYISNINNEAILDKLCKLL